MAAPCNLIRRNASGWHNFQPGRPVVGATPNRVGVCVGPSLYEATAHECGGRGSVWWLGALAHVCRARVSRGRAALSVPLSSLCRGGCGAAPRRGARSLYIAIYGIVAAISLLFSRVFTVRLFPRRQTDRVHKKIVEKTVPCAHVLMRSFTAHVVPCAPTHTCRIRAGPWGPPRGTSLDQSVAWAPWQLCRAPMHSIVRGPGRAEGACAADSRDCSRLPPSLSVRGWHPAHTKRTRRGSSGRPSGDSPSRSRRSRNQGTPIRAPR
jgi:hypothetical protein